MLWGTWKDTDHMKFSTLIGSDDPNWIVLANLISLPQSWKVLDMKWEVVTSSRSIFPYWVNFT